VDIKGWSLLKIIANVYNTSETLINGDKKLLDTKLNIKVLMPRNQPEMIDILLKEALKKKLNLEVNPIDKELELLALTAPNGLTKYLKEPNQNKGKFSADDGVIAARHWTLASLIRNIELELGESIFDGTKLDKRYDYDLYWNHGDPKSIIKALDEQLGLILKSTIMTMETLEVKQKRTKN